jgi:drug/metabolite transporter (DMT)-like permease
MGAVILLDKRKRKLWQEVEKRDMWLGLLGGIIYLGAGAFMLISYVYIPASIGFTIIQLSALWTVAIGVFFFKEIDCKIYAFRLFMGILFALVGIGLLFFAKE